MNNKQENECPVCGSGSTSRMNRMLLLRELKVENEALHGIIKSQKQTHDALIKKLNDEETNRMRKALDLVLQYHQTTTWLTTEYQTHELVDMVGAVKKALEISEDI